MSESRQDLIDDAQRIRTHDPLCVKRSFDDSAPVARLTGIRKPFLKQFLGKYHYFLFVTWQDVEKRIISHRGCKLYHLNFDRFFWKYSIFLS